MPTINTNPYVSRRPVVNPSELHGRGTVITDLLQRLIGSPSGPQCCLLLGMSRVGKSSVLNFLTHPEGACIRYSEYFLAHSQVLLVKVDLN